MKGPKLHIVITKEGIKEFKIDEAKFSKWYRWKERENIVDNEYPGVYMLAKFKRMPSGKANELFKNIIYFGETCTALDDRISAFHRTAFNSKSGHSAGRTYREKYPGDKGNNLFVSIMPLKENNYFRDYFIRFLERKLIFGYVLKHKGEKPELNQK